MRFFSAEAAAKTAIEAAAEATTETAAEATIGKWSNRIGDDLMFKGKKDHKPNNKITPSAARGGGITG